MTALSDPPGDTAPYAPDRPTEARWRVLARQAQLPMWSGLQVSVQMVVALLSARWLGPGDRGDYVLGTTVATLLLLVSSLGAGGASRVMLAERDRWWTWRRYLRLAGVLTVPHVLLSATVGLAVLSWLAGGWAAMALPFVVYSATALPAHLLREGLHGLGRHRTTLGIDVANAAGQLGLIALAHAGGVLTPAVALYIGAVCYAGCLVAQSTIGAIADGRGAPRPPLGARAWWHEAAAFLRISRFALLAALGQSFVVIGDRLVLGAVGTPADVGVYAVGSSLAQLTWVAPVALTALLTRGTAQAQSLEMWQRMHRPVLALTALLAVLVAVAGWFAVPFLLGDEFERARGVLPILCVAAIPYASYHFDSAACAGLRDLRTGGIGALQGSLTLLVASAAGYAVLGLHGIAYGVLVTYLGMAVATRWRMPGGRLARRRSPVASSAPLDGPPMTPAPDGPPVVPAPEVPLATGTSDGPPGSPGGLRVVPAEEWDAVLSRMGISGTYTREAYSRVSALLAPAGTRPVLLHGTGDDGEMALPLLLTPLPDGSGWDAASAYGYGGPLAHGRPDPAAFGAELDDWARSAGVVTTFLRLDPMRGNARLVPPTADLQLLGATVAWDVRAGRDLRASMHAHHRRATRTADRAGVTTRVVPEPQDLDRFRELYTTTMERQGADPFFFFPPAYWEGLLTERASLRPLLVEGLLDGEVVASLLCFADGPWLHYHLGASDDAARSIGASHRCFLAAAEWAQAEGMTSLHLGGGVGGSRTSPLFEFKHRFDPAAQPMPYHVAKLVHDPVRYRRLGGSDSTEGFFPPWRRSTPPPALAVSRNAS